ncbi:uncharacterized protein ALTATR162_LOCUS5255 [Alternaria atra]|uniref:Uncharacterized protein n=1 Tax=Alternaria atra TaxID=119953 RepID=A0A8J2HZU7_9PLEO|nr:uncharacterized protein ALTATR162_LOCUS5255 [Alternaria atra]CAG5158789.1 unnamed protein product [Alternaria atra]
MGNFDPPPSYTPTAAPAEYAVSAEPGHHEQQGSGLQKLTISNDVHNKTSGGNRPGGHSQTLKGPHGPEADSRTSTSEVGWVSKNMTAKRRLSKVLQLGSPVNSHSKLKLWMHDHNNAMIWD